MLSRLRTFLGSLKRVIYRRIRRDLPKSMIYKLCLININEIINTKNLRKYLVSLVKAHRLLDTFT